MSKFENAGRICTIYNSQNLKISKLPIRTFAHSPIRPFAHFQIFKFSNFQIIKLLNV